LREALAGTPVPPDAVQLVETPDREAAAAMMKATGLIDVLIPRGGRELIRRVVATASVPVIETGAGVCHTYVDQHADLAQALGSVVNAKVQRPSVGNAMDARLVREGVAGRFLPAGADALGGRGGERRGGPGARAVVPAMRPAAEDDWRAGYLDLILAVRV